MVIPCDMIHTWRISIQCEMCQRERVVIRRRRCHADEANFKKEVKYVRCKGCKMTKVMYFYCGVGYRDVDYVTSTNDTGNLRLDIVVERIEDDC